MRKYFAHHRRLGGGIKPVTADDPASLKRQQINRIFVVEYIDFALVGLAKRFPPPLVDEDVVPNAEMLFENVLVEVAVRHRNHVYHTSPLILDGSWNLFSNQRVGYWDFSQVISRSGIDDPVADRDCHGVRSIDRT